jgi:uncharacterized protein (DUF1501 family)
MVIKGLTRKAAIDRRGFIKAGCACLAGWSAASLLPTGLVTGALAAPITGRRLLFIFLRGGNDGINTLIPHGDPEYNATNRPSLFISPSQAIDLGNGFASLHPKMADLDDLRLAGKLAMIHRVGYPNQSRSHFDSQRIWENGNPSNPQLFEGFLYRYLIDSGAAQGKLLPALTAQASPPLVMKGATTFVNIADPADFDFDQSEPLKTKIIGTLRSAHDDLAGSQPYRALLRSTGVSLYDTLSVYRAWDVVNWNPTDPATGYHLFPVDSSTNPPAPGGGSRFSSASYEFFDSLRLCAKTLLESPETCVVGTGFGSFDSHNAQGLLTGFQPDKLEWLAYGLRSLSIALQPIWNDVVVITMSEFGRTSAGNGSGGTDHAEASCVFVTGGSVHGGVYNCDPNTWAPGDIFSDPTGRYLARVTDYRAIFAEILREHMGCDAATLDLVFPGYSTAGLAELDIV